MGAQDLCSAFLRHPHGKSERALAHRPAIGQLGRRACAPSPWAARKVDSVGPTRGWNALQYSLRNGRRLWTRADLHPQLNRRGRTSFSPHCRRRTTSACCRIWNRFAAARQGRLRIRRPAGIRVFPDQQHRVPALRDGRRSVGGDRRRRQRGHGRHCPVHGRRNHAEPRGGAKRGPRIPVRAAC